MCNAQSLRSTTHNIFAERCAIGYTGPQCRRSKKLSSCQNLRHTTIQVRTTLLSENCNRKLRNVGATALIVHSVVTNKVCTARLCRSHKTTVTKQIRGRGDTNSQSRKHKQRKSFFVHYLQILYTTWHSVHSVQEVIS